MNQYLSIIDLVFAPLLLTLFFFNAKRIQMRHIEEQPYYRYYVTGLFVKLFGAIAICLVYVFYYGGGDTLNYYSDNTVISRLFVQSPLKALSYTFGANTADKWFYFDINTGWPIYFVDTHASMITKITWVLSLVTFNSFTGQTMILAWLSYFLIWRMYEVFLMEFPGLSKEFAISLFFVPSLFFWGSGLLKDTVTFAAVTLFTSSFYYLVVKKQRQVLNISYMVFASILLINIKPYIFFALLPGSLLWYSGIGLSKIDNKLLRAYMGPILGVITLLSVFVVLQFMSSFLGDYSLDNVLNKAVVTQQDLKAEYYQGSSFDIGDFDPTIPGILSKMPLAITACLFRPYLWESNNPGMMMSGLENFIMLLFTLYLLVKLRVYNVFRLMFRHRLLFFTVSFSLFFSFSVGLTTSNFGSLVRYKIPAIPFYLISLFVIRHTYQELREEDKSRALPASGLVSEAG